MDFVWWWLAGADFAGGELFLLAVHRRTASGGFSEPHTDGDGYSYRHGNRYAHADRYTHSDRYADTDPRANSHTDDTPDAHFDLDAGRHPNSHANLHAFSQSDACRCCCLRPCMGFS